MNAEKINKMWEIGELANKTQEKHWENEMGRSMKAWRQIVSSLKNMISAKNDFFIYKTLICSIITKSIYFMKPMRNIFYKMLIFNNFLITNFNNNKIRVFDILVCPKLSESK